MERARRQAAGPLRVILEASKAGTPPLAAKPAAAGPRGLAAATPAGPTTAPAAPSVLTSATSSAARDVVVRPVVITPSVPPPSPLSPTRTAAAAPSITAPTAGIATTTAAQPAAALLPPERPPEAAPADAAVPVTDRAPAAATLTADAAVRPKLIRRVDPDLNQRMLDDIGRNAVVLVDLTIRADGSVAVVQPLGVVPRAVQRVLVAAMEQWRFDPLPQQRVHRIELVFNSGS